MEWHVRSCITWFSFLILMAFILECLDPLMT